MHFDTPQTIDIIQHLVLNEYLYDIDKYYIVNVINFSKKQPIIITIQNFMLTLYKIEFYYIDKVTKNINLSLQLQIYIANTVFTRIGKKMLLIKSSSGNITVETMNKKEMDVLVDTIQRESQSPRL